MVHEFTANAAQIGERWKEVSPGMPASQGIEDEERSIENKNPCESWQEWECKWR